MVAGLKTLRLEVQFAIAGGRMQLPEKLKWPLFGKAFS